MSSSNMHNTFSVPEKQFRNSAWQQIHIYPRIKSKRGN